MDYDTCSHTGVYDWLYHFLQCLQQADPPSVGVSLGGED